MLRCFWMWMARYSNLRTGPKRSFSMTLQDEGVFILNDTQWGRSDLILGRFIGKLIVALHVQYTRFNSATISQGLFSG